MGSIRKQEGVRGTTWLARVRKNGQSDTATFPTKTDAKAWIIQQESAVQSGKPLDVSKIKKQFLADIFDEYSKEGQVSVEKKCHLGRLQTLMSSIRFKDFNSHSFGIFMAELKKLDVPRQEKWKKPHPHFNGSMVEIDGELVRRKISNSKCRKYYYAVRTCLIWHAKKYDYHFDNKPFMDNPPPPAWENPRTRIVEESSNELERLLLACNKSRVNQQHLKDIIQFQIFSAMRMGETLKMEWRHIILNESEPWASYIHIPKAHQKSKEHKSIEDRNVSLNPELFQLVKTSLLPRKGKPQEKVFPFWKDSSTLSKRFRVIWTNAGVQNFKAHDFRHTATTHIIERSDLSSIQVATQTGHASLDTLKRYYKNRPQETGLQLWKSLGAIPPKSKPTESKKLKAKHPSVKS
jgi:integrase